MQSIYKLLAVGSVRMGPAICFTKGGAECEPSRLVPLLTGFESAFAFSGHLFVEPTHPNNSYIRQLDEGSGGRAPSNARLVSAAVNAPENRAVRIG